MAATVFLEKVPFLKRNLINSILASASLNRLQQTFEFGGVFCDFLNRVNKITTAAYGGLFLFECGPMIFVLYFVPLLLNPKKAESKTYLNYYRPAFKEGALSRSFAYRLETQNNLPKKSANKRKLLHIKSLNKMVQKKYLFTWKFGLW